MPKVVGMNITGALIALLVAAVSRFFVCKVVKQLCRVGNIVLGILGALIFSLETLPFSAQPS